MNDLIIESEDMKKALAISQKSKREAKSFQKLFHCTNSTAFLNIVRNREFWLSSLKRVNDSIEFEMIDYEKYNTSYYVACFTTKNNISIDHWRKYGNTEDGILFSINQSWFTKEATFLTECNQRMDDYFYKILADKETCLKYKFDEQKKRHIVYPYYIEDFGFYKVLYDDDLSPKIKGEGRLITDSGTILGTTIVPSVAGIVKRTNGIDNKSGLKADWKDESEVRIKICIVQMKPDSEIVYKNSSFSPKVAVSLNENAFNNFDVAFSPDFKEEKKISVLEEVKNIVPGAIINVL